VGHCFGIANGGEIDLPTRRCFVEGEWVWIFVVLTANYSRIAFDGNVAFLNLDFKAGGRTVANDRPTSLAKFFAGGFLKIFGGADHIHKGLIQLVLVWATDRDVPE